MNERVSAVISPKGRIPVQFLERFGPLLFPDKAELIRRAGEVIEEDKQYMSPLRSKEEVRSVIADYSKGYSELKNMLGVIPDLIRNGQPWRIGFDSVDGVVEGVPFILYGDSNPIETLRENKVNLAVTTNDLLLEQFISLLPPNLSIEDLETPPVVLEKLLGDTTTIDYRMTLNLDRSRQMLVMNYNPGNLKVRNGIPLLEEGTEIAINGESYLIFKYIFGDRYRLREGEKVETYVLRQNGKRAGIEIVSSGNTLLREATRYGTHFWVYSKPLIKSNAILLGNKARREGSGLFYKAIGFIEEVNQQISPREETLEESMKANLAKHLIY